MSEQAFSTDKNFWPTIHHLSQSDRLTQAITAKWALKAVAPEMYGF
ncbi:hypothetical protein [Nostoc sp. PCC 7524]|nr:hypothetical protein [Nostoc sp. PCC 7524]